MIHHVNARLDEAQTGIKHWEEISVNSHMQMTLPYQKTERKLKRASFVKVKVKKQKQNSTYIKK